MKEVFKLNQSQTYDFRSQNALKVEQYNTVRYGKKSLRILGPQIWNSLPNEHKTTTKSRPIQTSDESVEGSEMLM